MKRIFSILFLLVLVLSCLTACGAGTAAIGASNDGKIHIVTTIFPEYDWVRNIVGEEAENVEITMLLDNGVDLHSFQPTVDDILKISTCDLFIYVGGNSDKWVDDALREATNKNMIVIDLMDVLGDIVREEEIVEGMEAEEEDEEEEGPEYDEHVWLSLRNAEVLVQSISDAIQKIDPEHAEAYKKNTDSYLNQLNDLDDKYKDVVSGAKRDTLLFGDRFPFRYLVDDYGLHYYAAFVGCSAESEASFDTVIFLAKKVDELSLDAVLTLEGTNHKIAETIVQNTTSKDQKVMSVDSMQSTTSKDSLEGATYLSIMEKNLAVLKKALN